MITVHLVFNAHLDPSWLWPWQSGLDEALATCRSACDRLDAHPELTFTRGEAWVYQQVEQLDPELFARIMAHVKSGRWEIAGGWWIQPDCNAPSGFAMEKQIALGQEYFRRRFGSVPTVAYNVDSFGHAATLPGYMRAAGQDSYVMMRPQPHEMALPARLFRWRGYEGGPEVTTFRIAGAYTNREMTEAHIRDAMSQLPPGVMHTMCFVGVGDHGGGPTEGQIAWLKEHWNSIEGARLVFSTPRRFFDAIAPQVSALPLVTGELQHHSIGCYSVCRPVKTALRRAEHLLRQAEIMHTLNPTEAGAALPEAWRHVCFNHFHDTLGGTCLPSAYPQMLAQLGFSAAVADEVLQLALRKQMRQLPGDRLQRLVLFNASDLPFNGWVEAEPWLDWRKWEPTWRVLDEESRPLPHQLIESEAANAGVNGRLLLPLQIAPRQWRILRLDCQGAADGGPSLVSASAQRISSDSGAAWTPQVLELPGGTALPLPRLDLISDTSDTWSHVIDRYGQEAVESAVWEEAKGVDHGPLMASVMQQGHIGRSRLRAEWRIYAGSPFVELRLGVHWLEKHKLLKLNVSLPGRVASRLDGILGGHLRRAADGRELPLRDWMLLDAAGGARQPLGIVCPAVYAADVTPDRVRLTLLRSPLMVHHDPHPPTAARGVVSDQGEHEFLFRFWGGPLEVEQLEVDATSLQRPPVSADLTRGMPSSLRTP